MRKTILTAITLISLITAAHAGNSYCDTRASQNEMVRCYNGAIETKDQQRNRMVQQIYGMPNLSDSEKRRINDIERRFEQAVNSQCGGNPICVYNSLNDHNIQLYQYIQENK